MDSDQDQDEQAMAEAMGFSSFGNQEDKASRYKRRKFNDITTPQEASASGSNKTTLGTRKNNDEINLDQDDDTPMPAANLPVKPQTAMPQVTLTHQGGKPKPGFVEGPKGSLPPRPPGKQSEGAKWYEGYYDSLSNANPWEKLELKMGLSPRGTFVAR